MFRKPRDWDSNSRTSKISLKPTPFTAYSPQSLRKKVLHELKNHPSASDIEQISVDSVSRYNYNGTLLVRFDLAKNIGDEGDTLMLYTSSGESQFGDDQTRTSPLTPRKGNLDRLLGLSPLLAENNDLDVVYFNIVNRSDAKNRHDELKGMGATWEKKECTKLSLDRVVVLAFTMSSRISDISGELGKQTFLNAMWEGVDMFVEGGRQSNDKNLLTLAKGFGGNLMEFGFDAWQAKQNRPKQHLEDLNKDLKDQIEKLKEKKKLLEAESNVRYE